MEQKRLELEKHFGVPITRHTPTIKLPKLELQKFNGNILKWQECCLNCDVNSISAKIRQILMARF